ncbi:MAG: hypothetical protein HYR55_19840 [Acidobacteria bacterium]|nr:hypothetical protein [Acidobacteriota bacterium]MBI3658437.1 hypothetical protein [Acidobacteriota bacterium]
MKAMQRDSHPGIRTANQYSTGGGKLEFRHLVWSEVLHATRSSAGASYNSQGQAQRRPWKESLPSTQALKGRNNGDQFLYRRRFLPYVIIDPKGSAPFQGA